MTATMEDREGKKKGPPKEKALGDEWTQKLCRRICRVLASLLLVKVKIVKEVERLRDRL